MWEPVPSEVMRWRELLPGEPRWPHNVAPHGNLVSPRPNRAMPIGVDIYWSCGRCTNAGARLLQTFLPVRGAGREKS
eukprot:10957566-Prorocentrum_lima.AAC.1